MRVDVPSERNFEVYHAVETYKLTRRETGKRYGISATRVQQIVSAVKEFLCDHGSVDLLNIPAADVELASLRMCYERLSHFYIKLMRQFNSLEHAMPGSSAAIRLLQAATRISVEQSKVASRICKVQRQLIESGELAEPAHTYYQEIEEDVDDEPAPTETITEEEAVTPPEEDCTEDDVEATDEEQSAYEEIITKLGPDATSDAIFRAVMQHATLSKAEKTPAQTTVAEEPPVHESGS